MLQSCFELWTIYKTLIQCFTSNCFWRIVCVTVVFCVSAMFVFTQWIRMENNCSAVFGISPTIHKIVSPVSPPPGHMFCWREEQHEGRSTVSRKQIYLIYKWWVRRGFCLFLPGLWSGEDQQEEKSVIQAKSVGMFCSPLLKKPLSLSSLVCDAPCFLKIYEGSDIPWN